MSRGIQTELARKYKDIQADHNKLSSARDKFKARKYTPESIYARLGHKYYLSPGTIEAIVFNRTAAQNPKKAKK